MEFDISKAVEKIVMQAQENQEEFIFETIRPYCENILQMKINKEEFKQILLNGTQKQTSCEDCISRDDALDAFKPKGISEELWMESNTYKVLTKLPSVTPKAAWVLCSERLPNEFADVLCNTDSEEIFIATYLGKMNDGTDCFDDNNGMMWEGDVIAWMPLPSSYQAESEE